MLVTRACARVRTIGSRWGVSVYSADNASARVLTPGLAGSFWGEPSGVSLALPLGGDLTQASERVKSPSRVKTASFRGQRERSRLEMKASLTQRQSSAIRMDRLCELKRR